MTCNQKIRNYFFGLTYEEFSKKHLYAGEIKFFKEEIEWALYEIDYKYFGSYEFTDQQSMAIDILEWVAKEYLKGER